MAKKNSTKKQSIKQLKQQDNSQKTKLPITFLKPKPMLDDSPKNVEEIIIPPEKREKILNDLRQVL